MTGDPPVARRALAVFVPAGAAGAAAALIAGGRTWATVQFHGAPAVRAAPVEVTGNDLVPALGPLALAAFAAVVAVLATRGVWRAIVGVVIALCGAAVAVTALRGVSTGQVVAVARERVTLAAGDQAAVTATWSWPALAALGGAVLAAAGLTAVLRGRHWPGMSTRYDRPTGTTPSTEASRSATPRDADRGMWEALDRGEDPTAESEAADRKPHGKS
ncbi:TIGR02234 family membrane protein [Sphaerisporangium rubeum]|uniref:Putative membrane protein (TIGR02234 family) n=1 Tax=Sphaerisporangium rubeum TaxID=321317 RepID=A0A7X0II76_9ACTN|nr:TIGR02234 family membrane protein [Sphaerisporangium rubeum]MBB6474478.1 putative membrane protein (TIGR02234 family) [Sphaerisporangium rubeum]